MTSGKTCVLCGEDCSTKNRVKDSHGNYYCKSCHQEAEVRNRQAATGPPSSPPVAPNVRDKTAGQPSPIPSRGDSDDSDFGLSLEADDSSAHNAGGDTPMSDDSFFPDPEFKLGDSDDELTLDDDTDHAARQPAAPVAAPAKKPDPKPNDPYIVMDEPDTPDSSEHHEYGTDRTVAEEIQPFDIFDDILSDPTSNTEGEMGMSLEPIPEPPPVAASPRMMTESPRSESSGAGMLWPKIIGILAMVFGGLGLLGVAVRAVMVLPTMFGDGNVPRMGGAIAGTAIAAAISWWQFSGGLGVLRLDSAGATSLRRWAFTMTILYVTCGSALFAAAGMFAGEGGNEAAIAAAGFRILGVIVLAFAAWPLIVAIWLSREAIKQQIESWD
jgi:hypothetical protein